MLLSKNCQKTDWLKHKQICNKIIQLKGSKEEENEIFETFNKIFEPWVEFNLPALELIVSQHLHTKVDFVTNHMLDVKFKYLSGKFEILSADIKSFSSLNQEELKFLTTTNNKRQSFVGIQCSILVSFILASATKVNTKTIVIEMDKSQDYKLATKDNRAYVDSINNGTGNLSNVSTIVNGDMFTDIQQMCGNCGENSHQGVKLMSCSVCYKAHYCSKECQKFHWKIHKVTCQVLLQQRKQEKGSLDSEMRKKLDAWMDYNMHMFQLMVSKHLHEQTDQVINNFLIIHLSYKNGIIKIKNYEIREVYEYLEMKLKLIDLEIHLNNI